MTLWGGFYTQTLLHTDAFTHRRFYTQTLLHTDAFTHRRFYTQMLLHTETFTHRRFYTLLRQLLHTEAFTHSEAFTDTFTHRHFYTQTLYTDTHRRFYNSRSFRHTDAFTHKHLRTEDGLEIAISPQFFAIELHFVRKTLVTGTDNLQIAILFQFLAIEPHFVRKGFTIAPGYPFCANRNFTLSFWRSNLISCERVAFRAVSLALPRAFKREIEKKERARGQESKRAREKVKM